MEFMTSMNVQGGWVMGKVHGAGTEHSETGV